VSPFSESFRFFLYCEIGVSHNGVAEDPSWIRHCVFGRVVSGTSEDGLAFIFRIKHRPRIIFSWAV
jgi:hypothetical protein